MREYIEVKQNVKNEVLMNNLQTKLNCSLGLPIKFVIVITEQEPKLIKKKEQKIKWQYYC